MSRVVRVESRLLCEHWESRFSFDDIEDQTVAYAFEQLWCPPDKLALIQRYETNLERSLYQALGTYRAEKIRVIDPVPTGKTL